MHQRPISKVKTFCRERIHSIPILLKSIKKPNSATKDCEEKTTYKHLHSINSKLKIWSIIPLGCMLALLFLTSNMFLIPSLDNKAYAAFPEFAASTGLDCSSPNTGLELGTTKPHGTVAPGEVIYGHQLIRIQMCNIDSYTIIMNTEELAGGTTLIGANNNTPANMPNNSWGYAWSEENADDATLTYKTIPDNGNVTLENASNLSSAQQTFIKRLSFAAKFANDAIPGHYTATAKVSFVATPKQVYTLSFNANNGSGAPAAQTCTTTTDSCSITISSTKPTRDGYVFQGWGEDSTTSTVSWASNSNITMTANKTIYAVWVADGPAVTGFGGIKKMQDMTSTICTNAAANATGQLYDARDDSTYTIQKLSDNKCWMTQNLRIINYTTKADDSQTGDFTIPASDPSGFSYSNYNNANAYYSGNEAYGAYYNWYAATAGTGTQSASSGEAKGSICPKGWKLPTKIEYDTVASKPGTSGSRTFNGTSYAGRFLDGTTATGSFFPLAGYYFNSSPGAVGSNGRYWSSTAVDNNRAYGLGVTSNSASTNYYDKYGGYFVRCVAK